MFTGLSFTFKRDDFTPREYLTKTVNDKLNILSFRDCYSITNQIKELANQYELVNEGNVYIAHNIDFLKDLYFLLRNEKYLALGAQRNSDIPNYNGIDSIYTAEQYCNIIKNNLSNLEWLLFYLTGRIATAQMFEKISKECFDDTGTIRKEWIDMCEAWGNEEPHNFEIIFWIA